MLKYAVALGIIGFVGLTAAPAQEPACLHGPLEAAAQAQRRQAALRFTRIVNTAEAAFHGRNQRYGQVSELPNVGAEPEGFYPQLSTDGATYTFSVKDTLDGCQFAFFSDQHGVIYTAQPIR